MKDFARWAIKHNMKWYDSNLFFSDTVTSLSNCCRLKSNIEDLGFFSSIGGTALRVGSVKVSTINLARIAYESENEQEYLVKLRDLNDLNLKLLDTVRHIIKRNIEKKLLPNYCDGLIDLSTQYCTVGVIRNLYETMKKFGYVKVDEFGNHFYTKEADTFGKKFLTLLLVGKNNLY